jgi:predicted enzyme related to lactoylglutathione lyase
MNRIVHFEIPATDPAALIAFYQEVLGWRFDQWGDQPYWLITTGEGEPGINGGLMARRDPAQPVVNTADVASLDESLARVEAAGGTVVVPKMPIPTVGWLAYFKDPDGNIFGLMESDPSAA